VGRHNSTAAVHDEVCHSLRNAGFQEIGQIGKRIAFEFDTLTSTMPLAVKYWEALTK
jgi:hypothetical protein